MKKTTNLLLIISLLSFCIISCGNNYEPEKFNVKTSEQISKRMNKFYKKFGTFEVTKVETKSVGESSFADIVDEAYWDNPASCCVHFTNSNIPDEDITATSYVTYEAGIFSSGWTERYVSTFYTNYFKKQMNDYYTEYLKKFLGDYEYKILLTSLNKYDISSNRYYYKDFDEFLQKKDTTENYYLLIKHDYDDALESKLIELRDDLKLNKIKVDFNKLKTDAELDLDSIEAVSDIPEV